MYEYSCKVVKVIDGDTADVDIDLGFGVWLKKQRIRFYGIDTPESRTSDVVEYGNAAKELVKFYLPVDSTQTLITHKDAVGKYGRILGQFKCYDSETDAWIILNDLLIQRHHAVEYHGQSKEEIAEQHIINRNLVDPFEIE